MNSKQKGNNFERKVAKILTEKLGMEFNRTPSSGGLRWASDNNVYGDIVTPDDFPFIIECKNRENWSFDQLMKGECKEFDSWAEQVEGDCDRFQNNTLEYAYPLIIFTKNRMPIYIAYKNIIYDKQYKNIIEKCIEDNQDEPMLYYKGWYINKMEG